MDGVNEIAKNPTKRRLDLDKLPTSTGEFAGFLNHKQYFSRSWASLAKDAMMVFVWKTSLTREAASQNLSATQQPRESCIKTLAVDI